MKIIILGYMGSGKSTIGKQLSEIVNMIHIDLDDYIEKKEGVTVKQIFSAKGEIYFRKIEHQYLKELINLKEDHVISLGGGTPCYANNMALVSKAPEVKSIYLNASIKTLAKRLKNEMTKRPLLKSISSEEQLYEFIGKHLFERNNFYTQADFKIGVDDKSEKDILEELLFKLF